MITVQAYRAVIGLFYGKARCIQQQNLDNRRGGSNWETDFVGRKRGNCNTSRWNPCLDMLYFASTFLLIFIGIVLYCNVNLAFVKLLRLMCDGDIESNPGPTYSILKVVKASYQQGNIRFGCTAGNQCACNSLFALAWSIIRKVALWNTFDLDYILDHGDLMYKKLNLNRPLAIIDLPDNIDTGICNISFEMLGNETGFLSFHNRLSFLQVLLKKHATSDGLLFMTLGYTFSILWNKRNYFLFDPHSRDDEGAIVENGNSVLLKFSSVSHIQKYIFEVYYPIQSLNTLQFEVQFVSLHKNDSEYANTICPINKIMANARSAKKRTDKIAHAKEKTADRVRKSVHFENIRGTDAHEQVKISDRIRKTLHCENIRGTDAHEQVKISDRIRKK